MENGLQHQEVRYNGIWKEKIGKRDSINFEKRKLKRWKVKEDLGVLVTKEMFSDKHVNKIAGETYNLLRRVRMAFTYKDEDMAKK